MAANANISRAEVLRDRSLSEGINRLTDTVQAALLDIGRVVAAIAAEAGLDVSIEPAKDAGKATLRFSFARREA